MDRRPLLVRKAVRLEPLVAALAVSGFWPRDQQIPPTFNEEGLQDLELPLPGGMIAEHDAPQLYAALEGAFSRQA